MCTVRTQSEIQLDDCLLLTQGSICVEDARNRAKGYRSSHPRRGTVTGLRYHDKKRDVIGYALRGEGTGRKDAASAAQESSVESYSSTVRKPIIAFQQNTTN